MDSLALDQHHLKGLHAEPVKCRGTIKNNRIFPDDIIQHVPYFFHPLLNHLAGTFNGSDKTKTLKTIVDKGFKKLQGHLFGQTTLVQAQMRSDDNDRSA